MTHTSKKGFTLAEVLTTLMVIGVVAAMTIPTLMNSTKDQQDKVAFKKAMSVLGQGAQLMIAKEVECKVTDNVELASCFANNAVSGTRGLSSKDDGGTAHTNENAIVTPDGMAFAFYYRGATNLTGSRSLSDICGERFTGSAGTDSKAVSSSGRAALDPTSWTGSDANCLVVVDTNGLIKGSKYFASSYSDIAGITYNIGSDKYAFILTGTGVVPVYTTGDTKGYGWVYGSGAEPSKPSSTANDSTPSTPGT